MFQLMDYEALRMDIRVRRQQPVGATPVRSHGVRRRVGGWLVGVGSRLAQDDGAAWRTAADST